MWYIIIIIIRVHHVQKYTRAILPDAALCQLFITKLHCKNKNQVWWGMGASATKHLFQILSTALATASSQHALSIILTTLSLSLNSYHPFTLLLIKFSNLFLSFTAYAHLITKCSVFSTSPFLHSLHTLSSLLKPCHLPISIPNSAVPPLNLAIILLRLLQSIPTQWALHSLSTCFPVISNFELPFAFSLQTAFTLRHAVAFNSCFTSFIVSPSYVTTLNPLHPNFTKLCCKSFTHFTLLPISKASSITTFTNLSSFILITCTQNSIPLLNASHFTGSISISICRETNG